MSTGLFVSVKRGRTFVRAEIESLSDEELQDLLRRATPLQMKAYIVWLVEWVQMKQRSEDAAPLVRETKGCSEDVKLPTGLFYGPKMGHIPKFSGVGSH